MQAVLNARGDGHLLSYAFSGSLVIQPLVTPSLRIDPNKDYAPVSILYETKQAIYTNMATPFNDVKGLIAYAKANPGKLNGGSSGIGGTSHLALELFKSITHINIVHVPYKGEGESIPALMGDQIQMTITPAGPKQFVDAGRLRVLATTGKERWSVFPDTPTVMEAGVPEFSFTLWIALIAPPGTPSDVVAKLNSAFNGALKSPEVLRRLQAVGGDVVIETPAQVTTRILADFERLGPVIRESGISAN